jgi:hypothetical protein
MTSRRGWLVLAGVSAAVLLAAGGVTAGLVLAGRPESPATMALQAGRAIAAAAGVRLTGTTSGGGASLTVTEAGTVAGSYTQDGYRVGIITINGVPYLKAQSATFWEDEDVLASIAGTITGRWAKAPAADVNVDFGALTPGLLSRALEHAGPRPAVTTVAHGRMIRLARNGADYYITTAAPNRLIRVAGGSEVTSYSFAVTPLRAAAMGPVFTALHSDVSQLLGAADPDGVLDPISNVHFGPGCSGPTSCTISTTATVTDPATPRTRVEMTVYFAASKTGKPFATCTDGAWTATGGVDNGVKVTLSCTLGGSAWSKWVDSHSETFSTWAWAGYQTSVNSASDVAQLQNGLDQQQARLTARKPQNRS